MSHIGLNPETQRQMMAGEMEVRARAARHADRADSRRRLWPRRRADSKPASARRSRTESSASRWTARAILVEPALRADFALVHAFVADYLGNLGYALTARNFNPVIAMAADTVIVSADNIVPVGVIPPDHVVTPAPVVDYLVANS